MPEHPIFAICSQYVDDLAALSPMTATELGIPGHDDQWDDTSPEGYVRLAELLRRVQGELTGLPATDDDPWAALAIQVLAEHLEESLEPIEHGDHLRELGHVQSLAAVIPMVFDLMSPDTPEGREAITARLERIAEPLDGWKHCLRAGLAQGLIAPKRQCRSSIDQLRQWTGEGGALTRLVEEVGGELADDDPLSGRLQAALAGAAAAAGDLARWLEEEYLPQATDVDGVGEERYARYARAFLGTTLDLPETYRWGWEHLLEIRGQMIALAAEVDPSKSLAEVVAGLASDPELSAPTQADFVEAMRARIEQAIEQLDGTHFDIPDEIRAADVKLAPVGAPLGAWFVPPSEDFSRPGTTWWSIGDKAPVPLWDEVSTAYHEGFPGHHLQLGIQVHLRQQLSRAHRLLVWRPGYGEGWALYAERLMAELGYFEEPAYRLGWLAGSALRAVRVAVDIGSHLDLPIPDDLPFANGAFHPGESWTFDIAVAALEHFAFQAHDVAVSEVTRYLGWPAQAISYKVGERAILALRDEVRLRDGDRFDLKAFHQQVLAHGTVGLDHLRQLVLGPA